MCAEVKAMGSAVWSSSETFAEVISNNRIFLCEDKTIRFICICLQIKIVVADEFEVWPLGHRGSKSSL